MTIHQGARAVLRRPILLSVVAAAIVAALLLALTLRVTPPVAVKLELTEAAATRLAGGGHPLCLRLIVADPSRPAASSDIGLRAERRCSFEPGVVQFRGHPYLRDLFDGRREATQIDIRATAFNKAAGRGEYDCDVVARPLEALPAGALTMRCGVL